ncbi:DUF3293 domain-containing protein [Pseudoxanthomonas sp. UTMC 1351]|uniref:DUF3293 domain-containing protein n=1 Tax=Pseudoxanthomonas sp. UTMC 1351 TaxID=2695853 RepID=UPI0034CEC9AF
MTETRDDEAMNDHGVPDAEKAQLAAAWAAAHYFVTIGRQEWLFHVGQSATDIERQLSADQYLLVTAWNPPPGEASRQANLDADERLRACLNAEHYVYHPALGCDGKGGATEHGWLVLNIPVERADALAREFRQGGILFWQRGEPVRLRMQWPCPAGFQDGGYIDWAG